MKAYISKTCQNRIGDSVECLRTYQTIDECQLPPPMFPVPPPPRPPYLPDLNSACSFPSCSIRPVIDAEYHSSPALPSFISITVGSAVAFVTLLVLTAFFYKHQKKIRSFLPCNKSDPQNHCDITHQNAVLYEEMMNVHNNGLMQTPIEMDEVKRSKAWLDVGYSTNYPVVKQSPLYICPPTVIQRQNFSQDLYNPVYEELSNSPENKGVESEETSDCEPRGQCSEDDFAEDESSVLGFPISQNCETVLYGTTNGFNRNRSKLMMEKRHAPNTLRLNDRISHKNKEIRSTKVVAAHNNFHDELLLDAFIQLCPNGTNTVSHHQFPCILPISNSKYDSVLKTHYCFSENRAMKQNNDSDSGYSHNTSGNGSTKESKKSNQYIVESPKILLS